MSYTPIGWQTGDTITAEKLNKMDNGWSVQNTQLFSETVTTESSEYGNEGNLAYTEQVSYSTISVVFNNTAYTCNRVLVDENSYGYGGVDGGWSYDFSVYPFALVFTEADGNIIATETAGTYTISVESNTLQISSDFNNAVNKCVDTSRMPLFCISGVTAYDDMAGSYDQGIMMYFHADSKCFYITQVTYNGVQFIPESPHVTATFVDNVFTVTIS